MLESYHFAKSTSNSKMEQENFEDRQLSLSGASTSSADISDNDDTYYDSDSTVEFTPAALRLERERQEAAAANDVDRAPSPSVFVDLMHYDNDDTNDSNDDNFDDPHNVEFAVDVFWQQQAAQQQQPEQQQPEQQQQPQQQPEQQQQQAVQQQQQAEQQQLFELLRQQLKELQHQQWLRQEREDQELQLRLEREEQNYQDWLQFERRRQIYRLQQLEQVRQRNRDHKRYRRQLLLNEQKICTICLDEHTEPTVTTCSHVFCRGCLSSWFALHKTSCPLCRREIENVD